MNSKVIKIFAALSVVFIIVIGVFTFYVKKRLDPESLRKEITLIIEKQYPNLNIEINSIKIDLGLTTEVEIFGVSLVTKSKSPSDLLRLKRTHVRVPFFNILTGGGVIKIELQDPQINFLEINEKSNWEIALDSNNKSIDQKKSVLPAFMSRSQINANLINLSVLMTKKDGAKNQFNFESIQFKDIGIKRPMAFKLNSVMDFEKVKFSSHTIGEFYLRSLLKDKIVKTNILSRIKNIEIKGKKLNIDEISCDAKILFRNDKSGKVELDISSEDLLKSKTTILIIKDEVEATIDSFQLKLGKLLSFFELPIKGLDSNEGWLELTGSVKSSPKTKITPDLNLTITKPLYLEKLDHKFEVSRFRLGLRGEEIELETVMRGYKGQATLTANNRFNVNEPIDFSKIETTNASLILNGLELPRSLFIAEKKDVEKKSVNGTKGEAPFLIPPVKLDVELKNISFVNEIVSGTAQFVLAKDSLAIKAMKLSYGEGLIYFDLTGKKILTRPVYTFNGEIKKLNTKLINSLLDPASPQVTGVIDTSIVGKFYEEIKYDVFIKGKTSNGELKNYDLSNLVNSQIDKINEYPYFNKKPLKQVKIPQDYDVISFDVNAKEDRVILKKSTFVGVKRKIELKAQGELKMAGRSELYLNLFDSKGNYLNFLKKNFNTSTLPIRLQGEGFNLSPDYEYTSGVLLRKLQSAAKSKVKRKLKTKAKVELKKIEDKLLKGKKAKDVLKDLFK